MNIAHSTSWNVQENAGIHGILLSEKDENYNQKSCEKTYFSLK